jgi:methyl coenzyme M reductase subunit C
LAQKRPVKAFNGRLAMALGHGGRAARRRTVPAGLFPAHWLAAQVAMASGQRIALQDVRGSVWKGPQC